MAQQTPDGSSPPDPAGPPQVGAATSEDRALVEALRRGDEAAFRQLVTGHHQAMLRLAMSHVPDRPTAEEVVQETWLAVIKGLDQFEGRSSLRTWIFHILLNKARTRGVREHRSVPFATLPSDDDHTGVDPGRFLGEASPWPGHWALPPRPWGDLPEDRLLAKELREVVDDAVDRLPPSQRQVMVLRDLEGWAPGEVCHLLHLTGVNERVLLHRARTKVRAALERHVEQSR